MQNQLALQWAKSNLYLQNQLALQNQAGQSEQNSIQNLGLSRLHNKTKNLATYRKLSKWLYSIPNDGHKQNKAAKKKYFCDKYENNRGNQNESGVSWYRF